MVESIDTVLVEAAQLTAVGRAVDAIALLRPVLVVHPDNSEAWCRLAAALLDAGDYQLCLDAAKRAITLGERSWAHRLASLSLAEMGRHEEAVVSAREAARRDPRDWRSLVTLSEVLGPVSPEESLETARRAAAVAPEVPRVHEVLGVAADRARDGELARRAYTDALLLDPGNAEVRARLDRLPRSIGARRTRAFARGLTDGTEPAWQPGTRAVGAARPEAQPAVEAEVIALPNRAEHVVAGQVEEAQDPVDARVDEPVPGTVRLSDGDVAGGEWAVGRSEVEQDVAPDPAEPKAWTVEAEWRQRMSSVWPVPAEPEPRDEVEPLIQVVAEPVPAEPPAARPPVREPRVPRAAVARPPVRERAAPRPPVAEPVVDDLAEPVVTGAPEGGPAEPARRVRRPVRKIVRQPAPEAVAVDVAQPKVVFGKPQQISLWLILRRSAGWQTIGGFLLVLAGRPQPSPLLAWFALALLGTVSVLAALGYRAIPARNRLAPEELLRRMPLLTVGAILLTLGTVMLALWTVALALGAGGVGVLVAAVVLSLAASLVGWLGLRRAAIR
ncbi:hypothetical protein V5P93_001357 [Actinokineospora auranticolor]|uniref:Tetratricopeptide repeat protein n=1 Tax=Actinokineospora auranticolor TaxID=155976 RepID=A0A2S6GUR3_9PSEU|nr:tetratricopeptide repeat protein [Actinokineospora auranticolor]PPK68985.1 hypothetical protein CLV40_104232 [Actinokineospora auranticolor]